MQFRRRAIAALAAGLIATGVPVCASAASQEPLRAKAQAELAAVTIDVDRANILYSPADNSSGSRFAQVAEYQQEYLAGRQSFDDGQYGEALEHLRKADEIIHSQPDWNQSE